MIYSSVTVPVNPVGEVALTREELWRGLVLKARDARSFLPQGRCTKCVVVEETASHFVREAVIDGEYLKEIVLLEPLEKVTFFQAAGPREGAIINEIIEEPEGGLALRFYCLLGLRAHWPGGKEEEKEQANFDGDDGYRAALASTLRQTRNLLNKPFPDSPGIEPQS